MNKSELEIGLETAWSILRSGWRKFDYSDSELIALSIYLKHNPHVVIFEDYERNSFDAEIKRIMKSGEC